MDNNSVVRFHLRNNLLINQPLLYIVSLVALQLNYLTHFFILSNAAVAIETLLHGLADTLEIQIIIETLNSCDTFATITLLDTDMDFGTTASATAEGVSGSTRKCCKNIDMISRKT